MRRIHFLVALCLALLLAPVTAAAGATGGGRATLAVSRADADPAAQGPELLPLRSPWGCRSAYRALCINKRTLRLYYTRYGWALHTFEVRLGRSSQPTRSGTFSVYWKHRWHWSILYGSAMPFSLFFSGGQAIHYSANFAEVGYDGSSHGCVNLRTWSGARWLYDNTPLWTRVYVGYW